MDTVDTEVVEGYEIPKVTYVSIVKAKAAWAGVDKEPLAAVVQATAEMFDEENERFDELHQLYIATVNEAVRLKETVTRLENEKRVLQDDSDRLKYTYSGQKTSANDMYELELRLLNGEVPHIDEVRRAIDTCRWTR